MSTITEIQERIVMSNLKTITGYGLALIVVLSLVVAACGIDTQYDSASNDTAVNEYNDGIVTYEDLATDPFGWEDFDVIPKDTWLSTISLWNGGTDDERWSICVTLVEGEADLGVLSAQDVFIETGLEMGLTPDEAWTFYATAVTGCEELSQY